MRFLNAGNALLFAYLLNAAIYVFGIARLLVKRKKPGDSASAFPSVSVIVPARNEEKNLPACLNALSRQDYPGEWDVWVVNDRSTDGTSSVASSFAEKYPNFNSIDILKAEKGVSPKKNAINRAITESKGKLIFTTDADCTMEPGWLRSMASKFRPETGMVIGIPVYKFSGKILHLYQALDYASISVVAAGMAAIGKPITCSAANLAYRREAFKDVGGFDSVGHFISGDDDLLMQKMYLNGKWKIASAADRDSFTYTLPVNSWAEVLEQRARWGSKGAYYPAFWTRMYLSFVFLLFFMYALLGWVIFPLKTMLAAWSGKLVADLFFTLLLAALIGDFRLLWGWVPVSVLQPFINVFAAVKGYLGKFKWK